MRIFGDQFIFDITITLLIIGAIFFSILIYVRGFYILSNKISEQHKSVIQDLLALYVNNIDTDEKQIIHNKLRALSKKELTAQILLNELMDVLDNFSGKTANSVIELYHQFQLHRLSIKKIKDERWSKKIEGIVEISSMEYIDGEKYLINLLNHSNKHVRRHAKVGLVELKKIKGLIDISKAPSIMSEWTYISILSILHRYPFRLEKTELKELENSTDQSIINLTNHIKKHHYLD